MKTLLKILISIMLTCLCLFGLTACESGYNGGGDTPPAHEHSFSSYVSDNNATCTANGTETAKCDNCEETDTREVQNSKLSHSFTSYASNNNATCTANGTETAKCDNCDATDTREIQDSKLSHSFTSYVSNNNATCTTNATETAKCDNCDATDTREIADTKLPHSFTTYVSDNNATCTVNGTETAKCDNCDATDTREVADSKLSHSFTNYISDNNATCTVNGTETAICDNCIETDTREKLNSKLGHSFTNYVSDNNASYESDGTKTAKCDNCEATDTIVDEGSKLTSQTGQISFSTLSLDGLNAYGVVSNKTEEFNFNNEVTVSGNATYVVSYDKYGSQQVLTKIVPINTGNNTFYVFEMQGANITKTYEVTIRRRPMHNVSFNTLGSYVESQSIEEDSLATEPTIIPTRAGYTFNGWNYDFTTPITGYTTIDAKWTANADTPYKVEYYLQNLNGYGYTIDNSLTENLTGTTDTTANAEIKDIEHFTAESQTVSGNINGNGSTVLKVYYTRNSYNLTLTALNNKGSVSGIYNGKYKYDKEVTLTATLNTGYTFTGWYNGEELLSDKTTYTFNVDKELDIVGKWTANTDTPYKVEYYLQNLNGYDYTIDNSLTENLIGTTDTIANAEIKEIEHFTAESQTVSENINGNGSTVLKVYYQRNEYTITFDGDGGTLSSGKSSQTVKYGGSVTAPTFTKTGYTHSGFDKSLTNVSENFTATATWQINQYTVTIKYGNGLEDKVITQDYNSEITETLPETLERSGYTFNGWDKVIPTTIPAQNTTINAKWLAIFNHYNGRITSLTSHGETLSEIIIPECVDGIAITSIGDRAFLDCTSLTSIEIPDSVTSIGNYAFEYCDSLTKVNYLGTIDSWAQIEFSGSASNPLYYAKNLYINDVLVTEVVITSATKISSYAFYDCTSLTSIVIPDSVTSIGNWAFGGCSLLTSVTFEENSKLEEISSDAFSDCRSLTSIVIPDSVTSIGSYAFHNCRSLTSIVIPDSVTSIGNCAFDDCSKLVEVINNSPNITVEKGSSSNGYLGYYALSVSNCDSTYVSKVSTDSNGYVIYTDGEDKILVGYVGEQTELTLPNDITKIYQRAFYSNDKITSVVIHDSVTSIGNWAFYDCDSLTSIVIPDSVTSIGEGAFHNCTSLTSIKYRGTEEEWSSISKGYDWDYNTGDYTIEYNYTGN